MIARLPRTIPVPDAVASLSGRQLSDRVLAACNRGLVVRLSDTPTLITKEER